MNPIIGILMDGTVCDEDRSGNINVRGAFVSVSLRLVPGALPGDTLLCDAGVAIAILETSQPPKEKVYVSCHSR